MTTTCTARWSHVKNPDDNSLFDFDRDQNSNDKDDIYSLQDWADLGECTKNPDYMNIYCQKVRYQSYLHVISINVRVLFTCPGTTV